MNRKGIISFEIDDIVYNVTFKYGFLKGMHDIEVFAGSRKEQYHVDAEILNYVPAFLMRVKDSFNTFILKIVMWLLRMQHRSQSKSQK